MADSPDPAGWHAVDQEEEAFRRRALLGSAAVIAIGAIAVGAWFRWFAPQPAPVTPPAAVAPSAAPAGARPGPAPGIQHPLSPAPPGEQPLPALAESDAPVRAALGGVLGEQAVKDFVVPENLVRHIVATVDNLPRRKLAVELRPVRPAPGSMVVATQGDIVTLSAQNYARYQPAVRMLQGLDAGALAGLYRHLYPLLQQAYEDLGYPEQYFNDRVVACIDDLLAAPDVREPIQLVQPKVFYEFADPRLEERSAGQKLLIRMGPQNARIVKDKLRELRAAIARPG